MGAPSAMKFGAYTAWLTLSASLVGHASSSAGAIAHGAAGRASARAAKATVELTRGVGVCGDDMVLVDGLFCTDARQRCLSWLDKDHLRCGRFAPTSCEGKRKPMRFCIDRYEYPNHEGDKPVVQMDFSAARAACAAGGKRLCNEDEWTLSCEGNRALPYPYGYKRNSNACNIDRELPTPEEGKTRLRAHWQAPVDQREASGTRAACVSPFGVHDMTGNVDEWVAADPGEGRRGALKGGYWGPVRDRCRMATLAHDERFSFYQIGFRCCKDTPERADKPEKSEKSEKPD